MRGQRQGLVAESVEGIKLPTKLLAGTRKTLDHACKPSAFDLASDLIPERGVNTIQSDQVRKLVRKAMVD